jgi:protein involved in polysaccharide export with SLBB domain
MTVVPTCAFAQYGRTVSKSSTEQYADEQLSRAERAADELVSLSADKIISLLREEPGLLLRAKKILVIKAYEQGRLLDPEDLTDDALFRLVRDDSHTRVLITHEIEQRYYVRARPTREELREGLIATTVRPGDKQGSPETQARTKSQEDAYWAKHDNTLETGPQPASEQNGVQPAVAPPSYGPIQPTPDQQRPTDSRRLVNRADAQPADERDINGDLLESVPSDVMQMPRVRPEQMPSLLTASINDKSFPGINRGGSQLPSYPGSTDPSAALSAVPRAGSTSDLPFLMPDQTQMAREQQLRPGQIIPRTEFPRAERRPDQQGLRHRPNPYADVPSLYDLYAQYSSRPAQVRRFGTEIFQNGTGNFDELPMDVPVGPEYVLGPGDGLKIDLWGGVSQRLQRVVDREGRVALPEVGSVEVTGKSLGDVQHMVQSVLRTQFRDVQADVSLARLRTVRVYVVGDVQRPGAYDVSSLSTPLNALYVAGGPTSRGSLRILQHYRSKQLVQQIDVYDLLLHGVRSGLQGLQPGDTILVPPLGAEVIVEGMVRRPAIYELNGEKSLAQVLELAGGVLQSGTLRHVDVERVEAHLSRAMLRLDVPENNNQDSVTKALEDFQIQDGDKIKISPILPYADKTVYLDGHVFRPGKYAYRERMKVSDLIKSYNEVLPEPYQKHAEIIRLNAPDYSPTVLAFNLDDALSGKDQDLVLKPFDTVRVFGRFDFEDTPEITVSGEVRDPGDHVTNGATYLRDAVYLAGGTTPDALLSDAQVFRRTQDGKLKVISVDLNKALAGNPADNILLEPKDRLFIHRNLGKVDPPTVKIEGEVARPGKYPLGDGMTATDLVKVAGGLRRGAYAEVADLTRYELERGTNVAGEHLTVPLAQALAGAPDSDVRLHDGDVLTIRQVAGWKDMGATITVKGEVVHPGTYGIKEGERLSSILQRAGGLRGDAYPYGAVFERTQVLDIEEKSRAQLVNEVQAQGDVLRQAPANDEDQRLAKQAALNQWQMTLERLQNTPPDGRLVIHISKNMKKWANTPYDIEVRAGDAIYIPKRPSMVMVDGAVYNPTAVSYKPGKSASWYLRQAGGPTNAANKKAVFVIRADGSVVGGSGGLFNGSAEHAMLQPGDMVVVPEKGFSANTRWKNILQASQLAYAVGIAIQVSRSF